LLEKKKIYLKTSGGVPFLPKLLSVEALIATHPGTLGKKLEFERRILSNEY
jgi:hypothetical protein